MTYSHNVIGVFPNRVTAERAVASLEEAGYPSSSISVIMRPETQAVVVENTQDVSESVAEGTIAGATLGGLAGLIAGLTALTVPGLGALFIAGPIALALGVTGVAATAVSGTLTGALAGGFLGGLVGLGLPEETARVYEEKIKAGGVMLAVAVTSTDGANQLQDTLNQLEATNTTIVPLH